jgi:hypothetical protein
MAESMKHVSTKRVVTLEEHAITVSAKEIVDLLVHDNPEQIVDPRDVSIQVTIPADEGKRQPFPASALLELIRAANGDIPEDAEVVIGVRWRQETEVTAAVGAPVQMVRAAANVQQMAVAAGADPSLAGTCQTCGAIPVFQGPTPDCQDQTGCGAVRARYGNMPIPQSVVPQQPGVVQGMVNSGPPMTPLPKGRAVNRETGETAFISKDGSLYGKHEYLNDRLSRRDI